MSDKAGGTPDAGSGSHGSEPHGAVLEAGRLGGISEAQRLAYLAAMGIDVWVPRNSDSAASLDTSSHASPAGGREADVPMSSQATSGATSAPPEAPARFVPSSESQVPGLPPGDVAKLDWQALKQGVARCTLCGLHTTRTQTVFGVGSHTADWLFIGEAPGADEDRLGEPFVGRAGQLLNNMLRAIGLSREQVYIANILKCRPPKNRDPRPEEAGACEPYLRRQIDLLRPKVIIALGRIAAQNLLNTHTPIGRMRGRQHVYAGTSIPLLVTYHPAYLLRSPGEKRKAWEDLLLAQKVVSGAKVVPR